jgi:hypothetical protein
MHQLVAERRGKQNAYIVHYLKKCAPTMRSGEEVF